MHNYFKSNYDIASYISTEMKLPFNWIKKTSMITPSANCARAEYISGIWLWIPTPCHHRHPFICVDKGSMITSRKTNIK